MDLRPRPASIALGPATVLVDGIRCGQVLDADIAFACIDCGGAIEPGLERLLSVRCEACRPAAEIHR